MIRPLHSFLKMTAIAMACAVASAPAMAEEQDLDISRTTFFGATAFTHQVYGGPLRKGYLYFYKSHLGETLRLRPVAQEELDDMRRVCRFMVKTAEASETGGVDDYYLEFGAGPGDPTTIPEDKRFVFVFTRERGCAADPSPATLQ
jgi:hypothetical protein